MSNFLVADIDGIQPIWAYKVLLVSEPHERLTHLLEQADGTIAAAERMTKEAERTVEVIDPSFECLQESYKQAVKFLENHREIEHEARRVKATIQLVLQQRQEDLLPPPPPEINLVY